MKKKYYATCNAFLEIVVDIQNKIEWTRKKVNEIPKTL